MIIDLCCGIGRFETSETVISIDYDPKTRPDIIADIKYLPLRPGLKPRICHASPTCTYVSKARRWRYGYNPKGIAETFELMAACYKAFDYLEAETCIMENPRGLEDMLGKKIKFKYDKSDIKQATTNFYLNRKSHLRSIIPYEVRQHLLTA